MFKKFYCFLFLLIISTYPVFSDNHTKFKAITCDLQLRAVLKKILMIPESEQLITFIEREGPVHIKINKHPLSKKFGAYWDMDTRTICLHVDSQTSEGMTIGSIIFELHNAAANSKFRSLDDRASKRKIDRETYIQGVEYIEYENSLKASALANIGIKMGIFPLDAALPIYNDFNEHYYFQKIGGHSAFIGQSYDNL